MKWSNLWKLKGGWEIEEYDEECGTVSCFHRKSGLIHHIQLPPLVRELMDTEYCRGQQEAQLKMRIAIGAEKKR